MCFKREGFSPRRHRSHGKSLRAHRGLRRHRRPPHGRAGGQGRIDRFPVPAVLRLTLGICSPPRRRPRRPLPDRSAPRRRGAQAALPAGHQRAAHPFPVRRRRGRGVRLHASGGRRSRAQPRASREDGPWRGALRHALRAAVRLCPGHTHGGKARRHGNPVRWTGRRARAGAAAALVRSDAGRGRSRRVSVHARRRRVGVVRSRGGDERRTVALREARLRARRVQGDRELLARAGSPAAPTKTAGARW